VSNLAVRDELNGTSVHLEQCREEAVKRERPRAMPEDRLVSQSEAQCMKI
jgi:hypothetical protein